MNNGRFIVLEGIDGAGTTTQTRLLERWMRKQGLPVATTREPTDGPIGTLIRQVLSGRVVTDEQQPLRPDTVALLFAADRLDHEESELRPLMARGVHVISDRYLWSSFAYQSIDCPLDWVRAINDRAPSPDLTVLLRVRPRVALDRIAATRTRHDRFEHERALTHVAEVYDRLVRENSSEGVLVVDGEAGVEEIAGRIAKAVRAIV